MSPHYGKIWSVIPPLMAAYFPTVRQDLYLVMINSTEHQRAHCSMVSTKTKNNPKKTTNIQLDVKQSAIFKNVIGDKLLNNYVLEEPMCLNYNDKFSLIVGGMLQFSAANYFFSLLWPW